MSEQQQTCRGLSKGKADASMSATVHLSLSPAKLRQLADKAEKLIQECPSIHVPESYFQIEHYYANSEGAQVAIRIFADWTT